MTRYDHFIRLLVLLCLVMAGMLLTVGVSGVLLFAEGATFEDLQQMGAQGAFPMSTSATRLLLMAQHLLTFILPAVVFGLIYYSKTWMVRMDLSTWPNPKNILWGILFMMAAYPVVTASHMLNEVIPLPDWAGSLEEQAAATLEKIIDMPHVGILLVNLIIISILPGIGEELIFRGILQKEMVGMTKSPIAAIWISAFIFSAIHFQFEGFLPRWVLGLALGYLYHWTRNLWVPIIAHAFNNGLQIILIYAMDLGIEDVDQQGMEQWQWWFVPVSAMVLFFLYRTIRRHNTPGENV